MHRLWLSVQRVERNIACPWVGGGGSAEIGINDGLLRLMLEHGHSAIHPGDNPADVIEAMVDVREVTNSDQGMWPETWGFTDEDDPEWTAHLAAQNASPPCDETGEGAAT